MFCNNTQSLNAQSPIVFIDVDNVIILKFLHPQKAPLFITVTVEGIVISSNDSHPLKKFSLISVIEEGNVTFFNDLHFVKTPSPNSLTESGMMISFRSVPLNTFDPIDVTDDGIVISMRFGQSHNTLSYNFIPS